MQTEVEINEAHHQRWREAADQHGGKFLVPDTVAAQLGEMLRQDWVRFCEERDNPVAAVKRDKTQRLTDFVRQCPGMEVTAQVLVGAGDCSLGTVHRFINDNRSSFRALGAGRYVIIDTAAERAAAKAPPTVTGSAPVAPAAPSSLPIPPTTPDASADAASGDLARFMGHDR